MLMLGVDIRNPSFFVTALRPDDPPHAKVAFKLRKATLWSLLSILKTTHNPLIDNLKLIICHVFGVLAIFYAWAGRVIRQRDWSIGGTSLRKFDQQ